jgi:hypothetical protein
MILRRFRTLTDRYHPSVPCTVGHPDRMILTCADQYNQVDTCVGIQCSELAVAVAAVVSEVNR